MLNQKKYTEAEYQVIRENPHMNMTVLAEKLNRSRKSIETVRTKLGIVSQPRWTDAEIVLVRDNPDLTLSELSKLTGRSASSCHRYRQILNETGQTPQGEAAIIHPVHEPDPAYRRTLAGIALTLARGDESVAAVLLVEMTNPSEDRPTVGKLCGREVDAP